MHVLAQNTALPNLRPSHHMAKMPDLRPSTNTTRLVDIGARMDIIIQRHRVTWIPFPLSVSSGNCTGSPFITRDRCAACNTLSTRRPLSPSVTGGQRVASASRKAWHSSRNGSSLVKGTSSPGLRHRLPCFQLNALIIQHEPLGYIVKTSHLL